ncbi:MAG: metal-sulfur cluster assembly factor [Candidatus Moraniibacteriota bacterium]
MSSDTLSKINAQLQTVLDPELFISIVDLGLVYNVTLSEDGMAHILMTLTTIGCPLFDTIQAEIREKVLAVDGVTDVHIELTFDPPWEVSKMTPSARAELGLD